MHPRLKAKIPKMLEWQFIDADWFVWLDSSIYITSDLITEWILDTAAVRPLCLFKHSYVNSIREEACRVRENLSRGFRISLGDTREGPYWNKQFTTTGIRNSLTTSSLG